MTVIAVFVTLLLPIPVIAWLAYLFGEWSWKLVGISYGLMVAVSIPYLLIMWGYSIWAKHRNRTKGPLQQRAQVSKPLLGAGILLIAIAVVCYAYLLNQHGMALPESARLLPLVAILGLGCLIRGMITRG